MGPTNLNTLEILTGDEHLICLNETNLSESDTTLLKLGNSCLIRSLDNITYKKGERVQPTKTVNGEQIICRKRSGYGTAIIEKLSGTTLHKASCEEEIVYALVNREDFNALFMTGYRSPSSTNEADITHFYTTLQSIIVQHNEPKLDIIMFIGDDNASFNSNTPSSKSAAAKAEIIFNKFGMIDMIPNVTTRGDKQPDSVYCYYNPERYTVNVSTIGELVGDHEMIQVEILKEGIAPEIPKYKRFAKRVLNVDNNERDLIIPYFTEKWIKKWENNIKPNMSDKKVNNCANGLIECLRRVYSACYKRKVVTVPTTVRKMDSAFNQEILQIRAQLKKMCYNIKENPDNIAMRTSFRNTKQKLDTLIQKATLARFEKQMKEQIDASRNINWKQFFEITGTLLNKNSYQTRIDKQLTEEQLMAKLDDIDKTFISRDPNVDTVLDGWTDITPEKKLCICYEEKYIGDTIKGLKKVSDFWKSAHKKLAKPLSLLMKLIRLNNYFPEQLRTSNCTFIGTPPKDRAIFSLDFLEKFTETVIQHAINDVKTEDGTMQTAYTEKRGTISCNAISLQCVEMAPKDEPVIQTQQDGVKAFNSTQREEAVAQAQLKYGAGRLFQTWFTGRTYLFKSKFGTVIRGHDADQGTMPGTILGVEAFALFIATMIALTGKNKDLLWPSFYADDTGPLFLKSKMVKFKEALDKVAVWCDKTGVRFHLTGDKKPVYIAYLKKGHEFDTEFDTMQLCGAPITRVNDIITLGLKIMVRKMDCMKCNGCKKDQRCDKNVNNGKLIDKYGYECEWNIGKIKMIAYRLQRIRHMISPEFMRHMVLLYLCAYIQYSSSIIWPRCSEPHKKTVRYYYSMALASCLSLSAPEALNLACCKWMSVTENNSDYEKLLEETGLPSIREMAGKNSISTLKQIFGMKTEWFIFHTKQSKRKFYELGKIKNVTKACFNTLLEQMFLNASLQIRNQEAAVDWREKARMDVIEDFDDIENIECVKLLKSVDVPYLRRFYLAEKVCQENDNFSHMKVFNTFMLSSRLEFGCLDPTDRIGNMKTPTATLIDKTTATFMGTPTRAGHDNPKAFNFNKLVNHKISCTFCDESIDFMSFGSRVNKSHLLHGCKKVPKSTPIRSRARSLNAKQVMKRLMRIQDCFEADGKKLSIVAHPTGIG